MRELKFRVWSEEDKQYRTDCDVFRLFHGKTGCPATVYSDEGDRFDIEQYTGLKDKNGKEIYDGDIIVDFDEFISVVDGNCAVISEKTCREKYFDEDDCSLERRTRPLIWVVNDYGYYPEKKETQVEVIGNIHENPELLEEEE